MPLYKVEMEGECREVYHVQADSPEEAMANWASGEHWLTETIGVEPVSAIEVED
jgi:hypothetical protein